MYLRIMTLLNQWKLTYSESSELRKSILNLVFILCTIATLVSVCINTYNQRPLSNILLPGALCTLILILRHFAKKPRLFYPIKLAFMLLISLIYIPIAWITSPGSSSAMPMYLILIFAVLVLLIEKPSEYLIPIGLVLEILYLLHYEAIYPDRFLPYTDLNYHAFDLSINFISVVVILTALLTLVNLRFAKEHQKLYDLSVTDQLTGAYNRRYLFKRLEEIHNMSRRNHRPYTVVMIDINHFKQVNDQYGHLHGDLVLRRLGASLKSICRNFDIVARYGGDEFLLILPDTTADTSESLCERIQADFKDIAAAYADVPLALAIGISENKDDDLESLLLEVDNRLYHKKHAMKS